MTPEFDSDPVPTRNQTAVVFSSPRIDNATRIDENGFVPNVRVGLSGYAYPEWQGEGLFYPTGTKRREYLTYYSSRYSALEAVGTWRQMPSEATVNRWIAETPEAFKICPKMHADVTHIARLKPKGFSALQAFIEALDPLERVGNLGPILAQLPPNLKRDDDLLGAFLDAIPHRPSISWAVEFRHESWSVPEVEATLRSRNVAWVTADEDGADAPIRVTADHLYVRLRKTAYSGDELEVWADRLRASAAEGKTVYAFVRHKDVEAPWRWADRLVGSLNNEW